MKIYNVKKVKLKDPLNIVEIKNPFGFLLTNPQADALWVALIFILKKVFFWYTLMNMSYGGPKEMAQRWGMCLFFQNIHFYCIYRYTAINSGIYMPVDFIYLY